MKKVVVALMLCCGLAAGAFAQVGTTTLSLLTGYAIPVATDWADTDMYDADGSFVLAGAGDYQFHDMMAVGLEAGYNFAHEIADISKDVTIFYVTPYLKVLHKKDKMTFFGIFGAGLYSLSADAPVVLEGGEDSKSGFGFNAGGGVMFDVAESIQVGVDVRWHHIFTVLSNDGHVNNIVPAARFAYFFGK